MAAMDDTLVIEGECTPGQEKTYLHLPFEMPSGAARLQVEYTYGNRIGAEPDQVGGNTLDLGVFDARGIDFLSAGFRGWSGSERESFFISETEATPGYLPGPLIPGRWHVLLGLYKIAPTGCSYSVRVTIHRETGHQAIAQMPSPMSDLPLSTSRALFAPWLRGELHCHTFHSDGDASPLELVQLAHERDLDFLAITDHNTTSSLEVLARLENPGLILLPGLEVTTFKGHFNAWGADEWFDFRVQSREQMAEAVRFASAHGALTSCNHPKPLGPPWEYPDVTNYDCVEVWNGTWGARNEHALDFWLSQLKRGKRKPAVGGSDFHRRSQMYETPPRVPGLPTTWVRVPGEADAASILRAIAQGHVTLSAQPEGPLLELDVESGLAQAGDQVSVSGKGQIDVRLRCRGGAGAELRLLDQRGILFSEQFREEDETVHPRLNVAASLYVRAELRDAESSMLAMTNPVYFAGG
jgi:PHP domain